MSQRERDARAAMREIIRVTGASQWHQEAGRLDYSMPSGEHIAKLANEVADAMDTERRKREAAEAPAPEHHACHAEIAAAMREGRDAGLREVREEEAPCPHGGLSRTACITCNRDGAAFRFSNDPSWPNADGLQLSAGGTATLAGPEPDAATVERCARAALDGYEGNDPPMYPHDWGQLPEDDRDAWRDVARAVLAAAGRGGK